jgi:hypothetical protein
MHTRIRRVALAAAAVAIVAIAGGVTYAVADIGSGGVINGCYKSQNGQLRLIDPATDSCLPSETAISWGQTGTQGPPGPPGPKGDKGEDLLFSSTLKPGQTLTGVYSAAGGADFFGTTIEFQPQLPAAIPFANQHYVGGANANCPGPGQAAPGHLCVYESWINAASFVQFVDPTSNAAFSVAPPQGVGLIFNGIGTQANTRGVWAVQPAASTAARTATSTGASTSPTASTHRTSSGLLVTPVSRSKARARHRR